VAWQQGQCRTSRAQRSRSPGTSGSPSRRPVASRCRRAEIRCPPARKTQKPLRPAGTTSVTVPATMSPPSPLTSFLPGGQQFAGWKAVPGEVAVHVGCRGVHLRTLLFPGKCAG
jgi:hypothetical protein